MLYLLAEWLNFEGVFHLVRYQTFRAGATLMTALFIGLVIGPRFIDMLRVRQPGVRGGQYSESSMRRSSSS